MNILSILSTDPTLPRPLKYPNFFGIIQKYVKHVSY
jgi:hypothetical protein